MPRAKFHNGSGWVDLDISGAVDFGGRLPFGPPGGGTIDEYLTFPPPLSNSDWYDAGANVGVRFAVAEAADWIGVRVWRSNTTQNPATEYVFAGNADTNALLSPNTYLAGSVRNDWVDTLFVTPVPVVSGVNYVASYHTDRYGFSRVSDGAVIPFSSPSGKLYTDGTLMSAVAVFTYVTNTVPATGSPNFHFNISPIVRFAV